MSEFALKGMCVLVLEDEFLIAMDVEQLCRDHGAAEVVVIRSLDELRGDPLGNRKVHVAIVDVMLSGESTVDFAKSLIDREIPFVFATGYSGGDGLFDGFPNVTIVGKPYVGDALIEAVRTAVEEQRRLSGSV